MFESETIKEAPNHPRKTLQEAIHLKPDLVTNVPYEHNETARAILEEISKSSRRIPFSKFMELSLYGSDGYYSRGKPKSVPRKGQIL